MQIMSCGCYLNSQEIGDGSYVFQLRVLLKLLNEIGDGCAVITSPKYIIYVNKNVELDLLAIID